MTRTPTLLAGLLLAASGAAAQPRLALDHEAIAERIVKQLALKPGERVLSVAHPGLFEELVPHLRYAVIKAGGVDLGVIDVLADPWPERWDAALVRKATSSSRAAFKALLRDIEASIMLPGATPAHPAYAALQDWLKEGRGRTVHFHWLENGSAYALPGQPLPAPHAIDAFYQRALLRTDYAALGALQRRFEGAIRSGDVHVTSPAGTDLRFRVGDRPVNLQDGDASSERAARGRVLIDREIELPAGAVRVPPLEETVEGVVVFPPLQWAGRPVEGLKLRFVKGRVTEVTAPSGRDDALAEMAQAGDAGRAFREFALGLNPELAVPERAPWIPYYGYGAGVVRLSLGDNTELGGKVGGSYVRWNFFADTTVTVGAQVWIKDGKLVMR